MEQFYQLLKEYNRDFVMKGGDVPEWVLQYTKDDPPLYWKKVFEILKNEDKNQSIIEIGAGYGDITALLYFMGFRNIFSFEHDSNLVSKITDKTMHLFGIKAKVINRSYPQKLLFRPDILIQINCVYVTNLCSKTEYLKQIREFYEFNGVPVLYIYEYIDDSYSKESEDFPEFVRLNSSDIFQLFPNCVIEYYNTYRFPVNKTTKILCSIKLLK